MSAELQQQLQSSLGGSYRLERELGGGGMSRVFVAHETSLDRKVVVKVLLPELAAGVSVSRFRREIHLAAQLQHPHIVPVLSAGESDGLPYLIMPFVPGESLRARLAREGELPVAETVRLLRDVASALAYAHSSGVMHRDIKPDNVLLSGGAAVVTDFGVAKAVSLSAERPELGALTSLGVALGTPAYMAPEQAIGDAQTDYRADLYALGAMAYEMLAGRTPFVGRSAQATLAAQVIETPEPVERLRPSIPPALASLIARLLCKRPADRPQSAAEVIQVLDTISTPSGGTPTTEAIRLPAPVQPDNRRRLRILAASAVGAAAVVGAILLWRTTRLPPSATPGPVVSSTAPPKTAPAAPPALPPVPAAESAAESSKATPAPALPRPTEPARSPPRRRAPSRRGAGVAAARPVPDTVAKPAADTQRAFAPPITPMAQDSAAGPPAVEAKPSPSPGVDSAPAAVPESAAPESAAPESAAPESAAPPPKPSPPTAARPAPRPPPAVANPRAGMTRLVAEYAAAVESRDVGNIRRVYPGMTAPQQQGWEQFFALVRDVQAQLALGRVEASGPAASAQISGTYRYLNSSTQQRESQSVRFVATLRRVGTTWQITEIR